MVERFGRKDAGSTERIRMEGRILKTDKAERTGRWARRRYKETKQEERGDMR